MTSAPTSSPVSVAPAGEATRGAAPRAVPGPHWVTFTVLVLVLASILLLEAYASAKFTPDSGHQSEAQNLVPATVLTGGPILNTTGEQPQSYRLPPRTVALTFDDGPDPTWTPEVLRELRRHQ
ncbi:MAG: hypothetical protein IRY92_09130, partial [Dactylosporangium sp.]|nr:hypothetical protein [Dactylosporangium sp.]